ncbi:low temperature requirement protein A [Microbacterium jejuense]|uniref:low temperature requirement protein A n=1 Tax=Microbacterium jejuense TaxID=1263637 RepID=UPI0031EB9A02
MATRDRDRTTLFEIFFDLVFVFALTRVVALVEADPEPASLLRATILLALLWWAWCAFIWLGNQVRLDRGFVRVGMLVAMAGLFVVALVIPEAWTRHPGGANPALVLAAAFAVVRGCYVVLFAVTARGRPRLRRQLLLDLGPQTVSIGLLVAGALLGDRWQAGLWAAAFVVDFAGGRSAARYRGWRVGSPRHFTERHDLVLIIALGETVLASGARVDPWSANLSALGVALLGFLITASLWWAFFGRLSADAARALEHADRSAQPSLARDGYTFGHFPLVAGVVLVAIGSTLLLDDVAAAPGEPASALAVAALGAGIVLYLVGLEIFRWILLRDRCGASLAGAGLIVAVMVSSAWYPAWIVPIVVAAITATTATAVGRRTPGAGEPLVQHPPAADQ